MIDNRYSKYDLAFLLSVMIAEINSTVDEEWAYELIVEMIEEGLAEDTAMFYGSLIKQCVARSLATN